MITTMQAGISAKGKSELQKHLKGRRLTYRQAALGKCYDCMGGYKDGKVDCDTPECSLHSFMPYKGIDSVSG